MVSTDEQTMVFRNPDGSFTARVAAGVKRVKGPDGRWRDVDLTLEDAPDGRYRPKVTPTPVALAKSADQPLAEVNVADGAAITLEAEGIDTGKRATRQDERGRSRARFDRALPGGISVEVESTTVGAKTTYTMPDAEAASRPIIERVTLPEGWIARQGSGVVELVDPTGAVAALWTGGFANDSAELEAETDVIMQLEPGEGPSVRARVVVADDWLNAPERAYPVRVDPAVLVVKKTTDYGGGDTWVRQDQPGVSGWSSTELRVGYNTTTHFRSILSFPTNLPSDAVIFDAWMQLRESAMWQCNEVRRINAHRNVTAWGPATTWTSRPELGEVAPDAYDDGLTCAGELAYFFMPEYVAAWHAAQHGQPGGQPNYGVSLVGNEGSTDPKYWKKYDSAETQNVPELWIDYSRPAAASAPLYPADGAQVATPTPTLASTKVAPSGAVQYWFRIATMPDAYSGNIVANSGWVTDPDYSIPSGALQDGMTYYWKVYTIDNGGIETVGPIHKFTHNRRLGNSSPSPVDTLGPVSVNLATGNLSVVTGGPSLATVGGPLATTFTYNSNAPGLSGLRGAYHHAGRDASGVMYYSVESFERVDPAVNFNWGLGSAGGPWLYNDYFAVKWTGFVTVPFNAGGTYYFGAASDDGVKIKVNGTEVLNRWFDQGNGGPVYGSGISLSAGQTVPIEIQYYEAEGRPASPCG